MPSKTSPSPLPRRLLKNHETLQLQLIFVLLAAISLATLSALLISGAIRGAERVVLSDTRNALRAANLELESHYGYRVTADSSWPSLPLAARDISLRAISQVTLRSYPGVEGGFAVGSQILGYSYPTHGSGNPKSDVPEAERPAIESTLAQAKSAGQGEQILRGSRDIVLIEAASKSDHLTWTMKRLSGLNDSGERRRNLLLVGLVVAAFASIIGTLATVIGLRRGLQEMQSGLARLETDFAFEMPVKSGELGLITQSVNRMATTRRSLESALRRADRLQAAGRMAANMAHEIRNPLNGIRLTMQLLKRRVATNEVRADDFDLVVGEVDRLNTLLSDLLAFREARQPTLENQPILPIIDRCVSLLEPTRRNVEIRIEADAPEIKASVDAKQLTQVLTNLLLNAFAAIPADGVIKIRLLAEAGVRIDITDSGPGVAAESKEHLFEPFYTTHGEGTGLGLAVSRELVTGMGGTLELLDASPGATFSLRFPPSKGSHETGPTG